MRRICSWGRRAAHSHPTFTFLAAAACATGIALQGCSQGTGGRSLLSRLTRSEATAEAAGQTSVALSDGEAVAGGLRQGTRRDADAQTSTAANRTASGTPSDAPASGPPSRDPWVRRPAPPIPDDGRPVASIGAVAPATGHRSRGVDEWLNEIGRGSNQTATPEPDGWARLSDIEVEAESSRPGRSTIDGQTALASSQQSGERPVWATSPTPQLAAPESRSTAPAQQVSATPSTSPPAVSDRGAAPPSERTQVARRTDSLLEVDALLSRAHDYEAQGNTFEAYRFALVAHQIVETERLVIPPGQERPIDYLDALSAAADVAFREPWRAGQTGAPTTQPSVSAAEARPANPFAEGHHPWLEASSDSVDSPFQQSRSFAEWRTLPVSESTSSVAPIDVPSESIDAQAGPIIRPSSFGTHRESNQRTSQDTESSSAGSVRPDVYGPRFSDPATSARSDVRETTVQPVSLSANLTDRIDTAGLNEPQQALDSLPGASDWRSAPATQFEVAPTVTAANSLLPASPVNQSMQFSQVGGGETAATFQGPAFGPGSSGESSAASAATDAEDALPLHELEELATEGDADDTARVAGKPLTFWAMIGGLILLLVCAMLRRPVESRESFH